VKVPSGKRRLLKVFILLYVVVAAAWVGHAVLGTRGTDKAYRLGPDLKDKHLAAPLEIRSLAGATLDEPLKRVLEHAGVGTVEVDDGLALPLRDAVGRTLRRVVLPAGALIKESLWNRVLAAERDLVSDVEVRVRGGGNIMGFSLDLALVVMNFLGLLCILYVVLWDPILAILDQRAETIRSDLDAARSKREAARGLHDKYTTLMDQAKKEREELMAAGRRDGEAERETLVGRAREEAEKVLARARDDIAGEADKARRELRREIAALSTQVATEILRREIRSEDQEALVQDFLNRLDAPADASPPAPETDDENP